jgi:hypothetical protein
LRRLASPNIALLHQNPALSMALNTKALRSSVTDGIAITPRYRERQLSSLHKALSAAKDDILGALKATSAITISESVAEYLLTLNAIKIYHSTCDPKACNEEEYAIANSKDFAKRRTPYGYASILSRALSFDTFALVDHDPFDPSYQQSRGVIFEGQSSQSAISSSRRICSPTARVAAVVDRSGDLKAAAKDLVQARFAFGGLSPYAPDVVLVNEFVVKEFGEAVAEAGLRFLSQAINGTTGPVKLDTDIDADLSSALEKQGTTLVTGDKGKVVLLRSRDTKLLSQKVNSPILIILPISSMDDGIDLLNSGDSTLLANYVYAAPAAGKYITQFVKSAASFVNHIAAELLIGGPAPSGFAPSAHPRYSIDMFSTPSPALVSSSARSQAVASLVSLGESTHQKNLEAALDASLNPIKEPFGPKIGFFEQGFLFNASVILSGVIVGTYCSIKYGYPAVLSVLHG